MVETPLSRLFARIEIPKYEFKTFTDFVQHHNHVWAGVEFKGYAACRTCRGFGKAYDSKDRDPYEGYKLATRKVCTECNGSGEADSSKLKATYLDERRIRRNEIREAQELRRRESEVYEILRRIKVGDLEIIANMAVRAYEQKP